MPTYLLHGFRWPRPLIRIHIILQNLDDAAAEWLMAPQTGETLVANFSAQYPEIMPSLPNLRFIEQYDPTDERTESKSQPYAYVADTVHEIKLGVDVDEVRGRGMGNDAWTSMVELRDKLAPGEKVAWFVVVCGDIERWAPPAEVAEETNGYDQYQATGGSVKSIASYDKRSSQGDSNGRPPTSKGLKRFFSMKSLRKTKSTKSLRQASDASEVPPPLPTSPLPTSPLPTSPRFPPTAPKPLPNLNERLPQSGNGRMSRGPPSVPGTAV
ncbi:hypothetical protein EG327_010350 [Venturia inaequalis]|uniref:Developmental regulator n=1 Tax=Venturia inaequalis TaxID=5025 RepID=A0A8H3YR67_VENIN|nr:hypothetical protein EG327_010350 [Venturia inaequalis]